MALLIYGVPVMIGFLCGYFLNWPINAGLAFVALCIMVGAMISASSPNRELAVVIDFIIAAVAFVYLLSMSITMFFVYGFSVNFNWILR